MSPGLYSPPSLTPTNWSTLDDAPASCFSLSTASRDRYTALVYAHTPHVDVTDGAGRITVVSLPVDTTPVAASGVVAWINASDATAFALYAATGASMVALTCSLTAGACVQVATLPIRAPVALCAVALQALPGGAERLWLGDAGDVPATLALDVTATGGALQSFSSPVLSNAIATSVALNEVAMGNASRIAYLDGTTLRVTRWEWVTNVQQGWGAPVDDAVTALVYDDAGGDARLYIGNPTCLNVRYANGTYLRIAGPQGLPMNNITSLVLDERVDATTPTRVLRRLWIGTSQGVVLFDPEAATAYGDLLPAVSRHVETPAHLRGNASAAAQAPHVGAGPAGTTAPLSSITQPRWKFFLGGRWMPVPASAPTSGYVMAIASAGNATLVVTPSGSALLRAVEWTLQDKAAWMASQLQQFDLYGNGLVGGCGMAGFGLYPCTYGPDDNNGLWTSLMVAAESFRYAVTGDSDAAAAALHWYDGMKLLNNVTGITGLIARSALPPGAPDCITSDPAWHNSTSMPGWCFKGTASSDEVAGHTMAYPLVADLVASTMNASVYDGVVATLLNLARYIVVNNFTLVDVTGQPTYWGHWEPAYINDDQSWSDTRGLNSLEILALINAASKYCITPSDCALFATAYDYLAHGNGYLRNMLNTRINAPCDINYSDDELTFFSYMALFWTATSSDAELLGAATASLQRSWTTAVSSLRSDLWGGIYLASLNATAGMPSPSALAVAQDVVWNLRTWSHDLITWPVSNTQRLDIQRNPEADRFGVAGNEAMVVLPEDERTQDRWNGDPFSLNDGGGTSMSDPGVWLYPYWLARYVGIVGAPATAEV